MLFLTDDMRADDLAYAPYIRRFFAQGVQFRNSFSNNPMCCPARASILTGRYSHNHHVLDVKPPWGFGSFDDRYTVATALQGAGYRTALVGKYMNLYGEQRSKVTGKDSGHYVPAGWTQWFGTLDDNHFGVPGGTYHYFDTTWNANGDIVRNRGKYSTDLIVDKSRQLVTEFAKESRPVLPAHLDGGAALRQPARGRRPEAAQALHARPAALGAWPLRRDAAQVAGSPLVHPLPRGRRPRQDLADPVAARGRARRPGRRPRAGPPARRDHLRRRPAVQEAHRAAARHRRARQHGRHLHLRQRPLPGRAPQADRQALSLRAVVPGPAAGARPWRSPGRTGSSRSPRSTWASRCSTSAAPRDGSRTPPTGARSHPRSTAATRRTTCRCSTRRWSRP